MKSFISRRDFLQKLSVVQTTAGSFCFYMAHNLCKKCTKCPCKTHSRFLSSAKVLPGMHFLLDKCTRLC